MTEPRRGSSIRRAGTALHGTPCLLLQRLDRLHRVGALAELGLTCGPINVHWHGAWVVVHRRGSCRSWR